MPTLPDSEAVRRKASNFLGQTLGFDNDPNRKALFYDAYDSNRRSLLRAHHWPFATAVVQLSRSPYKPPAFYQNHFYLPDDFLGVVYLNNTGEKNVNVTPYQPVQGGIYTDFPQLYLCYTRDFRDEKFFDPIFIDALALRIASELCLPLQQDKELLDFLTKKYEMLKFESMARCHPAPFF